MKTLLVAICLFVTSCSSYKILQEKAEIYKVTFYKSHNEWEYVNKTYSPIKVDDCYQLVIKTTKGIDSICISVGSYLKVYKNEDSVLAIFKWYDESDEIELQKIMPVNLR